MYKRTPANHMHPIQLANNRWLIGTYYGSTAPRRGSKPVIRAPPLSCVTWDIDEEGSDVSSWSYTATEAEYARRGFIGGSLAASLEW